MDTLIANYSSLRKNIVDNGIMHLLSDEFDYHFVISPSSPHFEHVVYTLSYTFLKDHFSHDNSKIKYIPVFSFDECAYHFRYFTNKLLELATINSSDFIFLDTLPQQYIENFPTSVDSIRVYVLSRGECSVEEIFDPQFLICSLDVNYLFNICNLIFHEPKLHNRALCELLSLTLSHTLQSIQQIPCSRMETQDLLVKISSLIPYFNFNRILTKAYLSLDLSDQTEAPFEVIDTFMSKTINLYYAKILLEFSNTLSDLPLTLSRAFQFLHLGPYNAFLGVTSCKSKFGTSRSFLFVAKTLEDYNLMSFCQMFIDFLFQYVEIGLEVYEYDTVELDCSDQFYILVFDQTNSSIQLTDITQIVSTLFSQVVAISLDETGSNFFKSLEKVGHSKRSSTRPKPFDIPTSDLRSKPNVIYQHMNQVTSKADHIKTYPQVRDFDICMRNTSGNQTEFPSEKVKHSNEIDWKKLRRRYKKVFINQQDFILDMELIQKFTKVYQHGGYIQDASRLPVILLYGKYLPFKFESKYPEILKQLFLYLISLLDSLIFDNYVLIYVHSGVQQTQLPSYSWIREFYEFLNGRMKKSLSSLYVVNPSVWVKTTLKLSKPFISKKFWQKLHFVVSMNDLFNLLNIEYNIIPEEFLNNTDFLNISNGKK